MMRTIRLICCVLVVFVARAAFAAETDHAAAIAAVVTEQIARLKSPDPQVRGRAAGLLGDFGPLAEAAAPALLGLLDDSAKATYRGYRDDPASVGELAAWALPRLGPSGLSAAVAMLKEARPERKARAVRILAAYQPGAEIRPRLLELAEDAAPEVRAEAMRALDGIGDEETGERLLLSDPRVKSTLQQGLKDKAWAVRAAAASALFGPDDLDPLDVLLAGLSSDDAAVRADAANRLGRIGPPRATDALLAALRDRDPAVRAAAANALYWIICIAGSYGEGTEDSGSATETGQTLELRAARALAAALHDPVPAVRARAAEALGLTQAPEALGALAVAAEDSDVEVAAGACKGLGELEDERAVRILKFGLQRKELPVRVAAAQGLASASHRVKGKALDEIISCLQGLLPGAPDPQVRIAVAESFTFSDQAWAGRALTTLLKSDPSSAVRAEAASVVGTLAGPEAEASLVAALEDPAAEVRARAAEAIGETIGMEGAAPRALPGLAKALEDPDEDVRAAAALALVLHARAEERARSAPVE
jgi:HEAT repeat protein